MPPRTPRPDAEYRYHKQWKLDRERGQLRTVDATATTDHINQLLAEGWTLRGIAAAAGVSVTALQHIANRHHTRCKRTTAEKVLAVTGAAIMARPDRDGFVRKDGAVRRIQALMAIGWRHSDITAAIRAADPAVRTESQMVLHQPGGFIYRGTHDAVCAAYDALSMKPGPSSITVGRARRLGYRPPLAWDDDTIDDAAGTPHIAKALPPVIVDEVAVERAMQGDTSCATPAEVSEAVAKLTVMGYSAAQIADRFGVTSRTIQRKRAVA